MRFIIKRVLNLALTTNSLKLVPVYNSNNKVYVKNRPTRVSGKNNYQLLTLIHLMEKYEWESCSRHIHTCSILQAIWIVLGHFCVRQKWSFWVGYSCMPKAITCDPNWCSCYNHFLFVLGYLLVTVIWLPYSG